MHGLALKLCIASIFFFLILTQRRVWRPPKELFAALSNLPIFMLMISV